MKVDSLKDDVRLPSDAVLKRVSSMIEFDVEALSKATNYTKKEILYGFYHVVQRKILFAEKGRVK